MKPPKPLEQMLQYSLGFTPEKRWVPIGMFRLLLITWLCTTMAIADTNKTIHFPKSENLEEFEDFNSDQSFSAPEPPSTTEPLFSLTSTHKLHTVKQGNTTLQLQTWEEAPHILFAQNENTPSYKLVNTVIDLGYFAAQMHNSQRYLNHHKSLKAYLDTSGFQSQFHARNEKSRQEFMRIPVKTSYQECQTSCHMANASIPRTMTQVKEADFVLNLQNQQIWVQTNQTTKKISKYKFKYEMHTGNKEIFPKNHSKEIKSCTVKKNGTEIAPSKIGYNYQWYADTVYHVTNGYRLETSLNKEGNCEIHTTIPDMSSDHHLDDSLCICAKDYSWWNTFEKNSLEAEALAMDLSPISESLGIEPWRFKTSGKGIITLDTISPKQGDLIPRYIKFSKNTAQNFDEKYITANDLSELILDDHFSKSLRTKDMFLSMIKKVGKTAISNPGLIKDFHKTMKQLITNSSSTTTLTPTKSIIGSDQSFQNRLNNKFRDYSFKKHNNVIKVEAHNGCKNCNWTALETSRKGREAAIGLAQARRNIAITKNFKKEIIPTILSDMLISREDLEDSEVVMDQEAITIIYWHKSYIEVRTFIPIKKKTTRRILNIAPLPFKFNKEQNSYIIKQLPRFLTLTAKDEATSVGPQTPCALELIKPARSTSHCPNTSTKFGHINLLLNTEELRIYLIKDIGTISITCPQTTTHWYELTHQCNIFLLSASCSLDTRGTKYNLAIKPLTTSPPTSISAVLLLSYNIYDDWVPSTLNRWVIQIITISGVSILLMATLIMGIFICKHKPFYGEIVQVMNRRFQSQTPQAPTTRTYMNMSSLEDNSSEEDFTPHRYAYGKDTITTRVPLSTTPLVLRKLDQENHMPIRKENIPLSFKVPRAKPEEP